MSTLEADRIPVYIAVNRVIPYDQSKFSRSNGKLFVTMSSRTRAILLALATAYFFSVTFLAVKELFTNYYGAGEVLLGNGMSVGGDFPIFYVAGKLFLSARENLYNFSLQIEQLRSLFAGTKYDQLWLVFVYPPPVAAFFSLLANFSLFNAYLIWLTISVCIFFLSTFLVISELEISLLEKWFILFSGISFIPFLFNCLGAGQLSILGLLIFSLGMYLRKTGNQWLEGVVLGFGFYKPPLFVFVGCLAIAERRWRVVWGAAASALVWLILSFLLVGKEQLVKYFILASNYRYGQQQTPGVSLPPFRGVGLFAFLSQYIANQTIVLATFSLFFLVFIVMMVLLKKAVKNKSSKLTSLIYSAEISLSVMFSVQCINYDLTLLLPAFYVILAYIISRRVDLLKIILLFCFILFHAEWLLRTTREGVEYSPIVPFLLVGWSLTIMAVSYINSFSHRAKENMIEVSS